jgi:hypothetical protein
LPFPREENPRRLNEIVVAARAGRPERYSPHRIGDVLVEARKETEAVLARQVGASADAGAGSRQASRFAAERVAPLVDGDGEAALGELLRGGEAADAAAQDRDGTFRRHRRGASDVTSSRTPPESACPG